MIKKSRLIKMKYFLITTSDKRSWGSHQNNIFLGSWCESFGKENPENLKIQNYHWDDKEKFERDIQYLNDLYETKLDELSIAMNKIHNETNNKSFWRIIIGPWLRFLNDSVFDRYENVSSLKKLHKIENTLILQYKLSDWAPSNFAGFYKQFTSDAWNHVVFSECIKELGLPHTDLDIKLKDKELDLASAQKIFGYFDKSQLINLFQLIFEGKETEVLNIYREIYNQGVEPRVFINDFLELLYYFKNIESLNIDGTNFSLNDEEFIKIKEISLNVNSEILILFWQFTIKTLEELDIVSNQHLSIEMFLIRLIHLKSAKNISEITQDSAEEISTLSQNKESDDLFEIQDKIKTIGQIKNIVQEKVIKPKENEEVDGSPNLIACFDSLLKMCSFKKEIKLKYELENNVNLISFENQKIEISFNERLDKDFVKDLSSKLYEWTNKRWIIILSKTKGDPTKKEKEINSKKELIENVKKSSLYKSVLEKFPDVDVFDVKKLENKKEND